jgi:hypothetical protein
MFTSGFCCVHGKRDFFNSLLGVNVMTEETDFKKYQPNLTEATVVKAAEAWGRGDEILSLNGKRTAIDAFILLLATDAEIHGPFLMKAKCARALCAFLLAEGFGP